MKKACLQIIAAASLWGCIGLFLKLLTAAGLTSMQGVALRSLAGCLSYGLFLFFTDRSALRADPRDWYWFFGTGVCSLLFFNWCYFNAITLSSMSVAAVLLYTSPVFVTLMSALFFREKITPVKITALIVTFAGCVLVTGLFPLGQAPISLQTILFGLGAGFGYALYSIFGKFVLKKYSPATVTFYTILTSALFSLPLSGLHTNLAALADGRAWAGALGVGVLCCALPYHLYTSGLKDAEPGRAAILATVEPFVAAGLGILLFHEAVTPWKLLGMAAILGAVLLLNLPEKNR
ncbi:EamA family transporter [Colidextribacter sp. OB.20]|uniref:DMT family transporter n=1 Tax=Colidextribacter sp. OB.20 TaxID=2304568 RepID=UPI001367EC90|nr:DMT family transporter [Colidextribacter sp. OB.20]NBI10873.1 EamA family transporter [Colidextribacter sp. OB.20]